jgi:rhamnulokinase
MGAGGKVRLLKNIAGLWLLQECRRDWTPRWREFSYEELMRMAAESESCGAILDPNVFLEPGHMPAKIAEHCRSTGQPVPAEPGAMCRTILESLAVTYRDVLEKLETLTGRHIETIHVVGGGSKNSLLNQLAARATGRTVIAGPVEATAAGNILVQAIGAGVVSGLDEARNIVRRSFPLERYSAT